MITEQLNLWDYRSETCPFADLVEDNDNNCFSQGQTKYGYDVISEDYSDLSKWLADIKNVGFDDIIAKPTELFELPPFIPVIRRGSYKMMSNVTPPFVAVSIGSIVNKKNLDVLEGDVRSKFGISPNSKIILLCFGKDELIEKIWTQKTDIFPKISRLNFDIVTGINYSIWYDQPHAERLINLKRSLITFSEFQELGVNAIPHMYWSGRKDILRWCKWISDNKDINIIAIDPQTERDNKVWNKTIEDLSFFVANLDRKIHFLITGPSTFKRISELKSVLPNFTLTNSYCSLKSACGSEIFNDKAVYSTNPKNETMLKNIDYYNNLLIK